MWRTEDPVEKRARAQAVHEEYKKLDKFYIDRRRIILVADDHDREEGYGIIRQAKLHHSTYLPAWLASRQYGPPPLVAVKQIKVSAVTNMLRAKRAFTREIVRKHGCSHHGNNGNVNEFAHAHTLEVPEKLSLVYDTIDALNFLHQLDPPVCHGDIKSTNVLVSADCKARLCDFGLARLHEGSGFGRLETSTGSKGSLRWCSPEILDGAPRAPTSDIYAWAWLVWEIMTGDLPYEGTYAEYAIILKIFESPVPQLDGASRLSDCLQVWELMTRCWNVNPQQRPTARICKTTFAYLPRCTPTPANSDQPIRSAALMENLGDLESWKGSPEKSSLYLDQALQLYQEQADAKGVAGVLRKQAVAAGRNADHIKAIVRGTAALEQFRSLDDPLGIADASLTVGDSLVMREGEDAALPILHEALDIYRTHGNDVGAGMCLERIGALQRAGFQRDEALSTLEEAVAVASRSGYQLGIAGALRTIGLVHLDRLDFDRAAEAFSHAHPIAQKIGWYAGLSDIGQRMGWIRMQLGDYQEAEALLRDSVSIARQGGARWDLAWGLNDLAECFQQQSKLEEATLALVEACLLFQELSRPNDSVRVASTLVELKCSQDDWNGALFWHDHIIAVSRSQQDHRKVVKHLERKGEILVKADRYDEAALQFEAAMLTRGEGGQFGYWQWRQLQRRLCTIPKTVMKWERRLPLLCDVRKLQRRHPQLVTASLKLPVRGAHGAL